MHRIVRLVTLLAVVVFVLASSCHWRASSNH
jgi:hypothetical protein